MRTSKPDQAGAPQKKTAPKKAKATPTTAAPASDTEPAELLEESVSEKLPEATAELAIADDRHPVTIAFEHYIRSGSATDEQRDRWIDELTQAVAEGARKFVGFNNVNSMKKSLDINLGLLSLGLLLKVEGRVDVKTWAEVIGKTSIKELLKEALVQLKALVYTDTYLFSEMVERPLRETVLAIATARERGRRHVWNGWREFLYERASRRSQQGSDKLARHLIQNLFGSEPEAWMKKVNRTHSEFGGMATAEETINTILLRHCLLKPKERLADDVYVATDFLRRIRAEYDAQPAQWLARVRARYDELLRSLPRDLLEQLHNWFDNHLKNGPPKLNIVKPKPKKKDDDDENDEIQEMEGVSGVYLSRIYS